MTAYPQEVKDYVEEFFFNYMDSMRTSKQVEDRYTELPPEVKYATTRRLREYAKGAADYVFDNINSIEELDNIEDSIVRAAIQSALDSD